MALAALREKLELWEEAVNAFESDDELGALDIFKALEPTSQIAMNLGFIYCIQKEYQKAVQHYTKAIALDSYMALAYFERGVAHFKIEKHMEAEADFCTAEVMMRGKSNWSYQEAGLNFELFLAEILFNKALVICKAGRDQEALTILRKAHGLISRIEHRIIGEMLEDIKGLPIRPLFSVTSRLPTVMFHPSPDRMKFLKSYGTCSSASIVEEESAYAQEYDDDNASVTFAGSCESLPLSKSKNYLTSPRSSVEGMATTYASTSFRSEPSRPMRSDLARAIGIDMIPPTVDITTIPCAGIRIVHGRLAGLMAWRLVVSLDDQGTLSRKQQIKKRHWLEVPRPSIVTNFILDTGVALSPIPQETLRALGW